MSWRSLLFRHVLDGDDFSGVILHEKEEGNEHGETKSERRPEKLQMEEEEEQHEGKSNQNEKHRRIVVHPGVSQSTRNRLHEH